MRSSLGSAARAAAFAGALLATTGAHSQNNERPASFDAAKILGDRVTGSNYTVTNPVASDGFMRIYNLKTTYGDFTVIGDALMQTRLQELGALRELEKTNQQEASGKALVESGLAPITYAGKLLTDPGKTLGNTFAGAGNFLGQVGSGISNAGKTQDDAMASLFGVTKKKRELAAQLHVDPYTDFQPLADKMTRLSEAAAGGSFAVNVGYMFIPGAAGIVISNVGTSNDMSDIARDNTAAQLMDRNRQKTTAMGLDKAIAETLVTNRAFSPIDLTSLVNALEAMPDVEGRVEFLRRAAMVNRRDAAFFMRRHAEVLAAYHSKTRSLASFVLLGDFPFNRLRNGGVLGLWPIDALSWTDNSSGTLQRMSEAHKRSGISGPAEIRISGQVTPLARQKLQALGWKVTDNFRL